MTPYIDQAAQNQRLRNEAYLQNQNRMKELVQQEMFQSQRDQAQHDWEKNNMTAFEAAQVKDRENQTKQLAQQKLDELEAAGKIERNPNPPQQQSPAQKVVNPPDGQAQTTPPVGADNPATGNGAPGMASTPGGTPSPSAPRPTLSPAYQAILGGGQGSAPPTGASASNGQTGAVGQASVGSVSPTQTAGGQTGADSGPQPSLEPPTKVTQPSPGTTPPTPGDSPVYDRTSPDGSYTYRVLGPEEQADRQQKIAKTIADQERQTKLTQLQAAFQGPLSGLPDYSKKGLTAEVMFNKPLPEETDKQVYAELLHEAQDAIKNHDEPAFQSAKELLQLHLTHGQSMPQNPWMIDGQGHTEQFVPGKAYPPSQGWRPLTQNPQDVNKTAAPILMIDPQTNRAVSVKDGSAVPSGAITPNQSGSINVPSGQTKSRVEAASGSIDAGNRIIGMLHDPKYAKVLGNLDSYVQMAIKNTPISDPDAARMISELRSFAALQPAVHGFRSHNALEDFSSIIGPIAKNPAAIEQSIMGIIDTARSVQGEIKRNGTPVETPPVETPPPTEPKVRTYNQSTGKLE